MAFQKRLPVAGGSAVPKFTPDSHSVNSEFINEETQDQQHPQLRLSYLHLLSPSATPSTGELRGR